MQFWTTETDPPLRLTPIPLSSITLRLTPTQASDPGIVTPSDAPVTVKPEIATWSAWTSKPPTTVLLAVLSALTEAHELARDRSGVKPRRFNRLVTVARG